MKCPKCEEDVPEDSLNEETDLGKCLQCGETFKISEVKAINFQSDWKQPPDGAYLIHEKDTTILGASTRSNQATFFVPFSIFWIGAILRGIFGGQISSGEFDLNLTLVGIPFLLGSILLISFTLMLTIGKVEFTIDRSGVRIFTGIGSIGKKESFTWSELKKVNITLTQYTNRAKNMTQIIQIELKGGRILDIGKLVSEERLSYLYNTFHQLSKKYNTMDEF
ncbi:MAG: hypothetical protein KDK54_16555 [Leptospiraceae bacterium]|nr:hypothetical protein [Leptospiraceae bacterium]